MTIIFLRIPCPSLFFLLVSLALSLAIVVPLTGAVVRFRANYNPKGLQLDAEGGAQPHTGPVVSTFFGMLKRVYRIEVRPRHKVPLLWHEFSTGMGRTLQRTEYGPDVIQDILETNCLSL